MAEHADRAEWEEQLESFVASGDPRSQLARIHAWCWQQEAKLPPEDLVIDYSQTADQPGTMPS